MSFILGFSSRREEKTDVKIGSSSFCNLAESSLQKLMLLLMMMIY